MSLRGKLLLAVLLLAGLGVAMIPSYVRHLRWRKAYAAVEKWAEGVERRPGKSEYFTYGDLELPHGGMEQYYVSTVEPRHDIDENGNDVWTFTGENDVEKERNKFFVYPPGHWVDSIDDVILSWERRGPGSVEHGQPAAR